MPLQDLLHLAAHAMHAPEVIDTSLAERHAALISAARMALLMSAGGFLLLWAFIETRMRREIAATGSFGFGLAQAIHAYLMVIALGVLLDGSVLTAALGTPDLLHATQAMEWVRSNPLPEINLTGSVRIDDETTILDAVWTQAFSTVLHGLAALGAGVALVAALVSARSGPLTHNLSHWAILALVLGTLGWPSATDAAAWAALRDNPVPLLSRMMGV